ncbi:Glyoxalase/Bleomycin resistance protein/Dioxygenase superfamily protein [Actinoplanes regularis]|uniref:Glyoxalase/Bleomycin resistance protein/Dioxygenase superfamily protein n=1 Tax=Actinoplanes regularis TaxID=52697 RepID=A0A238YSR5_9ACTN|nr:VOC family protein [Actinoplanes regularis]GIE85524.1 glyoxalase [Actinoplanes regularis]SNR73992.1 Glyoxalase/Bleomycin resistance protein/Dioxygenase superfamily protein [Actinoplanes regularis]
MQITTTTVSLTVDDVVASRDFLTSHLGYATTTEADGFAALRREDEAADLVLLRRGIEVLPEEQRDQRAAGVILAFTVTDLDAVLASLVEACVPITLPLREESWGERLFQITDPNGVVIQFVEWVTPAA